MMTPGPAEKEISALQAFLAITESPRYGNDSGVARLRAAATKLHQHLRRPVRVLVAGGDGGDDLALANALCTEQVIPPGTVPDDYPPFVFTYGQTIAAAPGWWRKKVKTRYRKIDLDELAGHNPDFIILQVPTPLLRQVNIWFVPGAGGPDYAGRLQGIAARSDMLMWCTNAARAWGEREQQTWKMLPAPIRENGILAVTEVDLPEIQRQFKEITARLFMEAKPGFKAIFPLKSNATAASRQDHASDGWKASGGQALVAGMQKLVIEIRKNEARKARATIDQHFAPFLAGVEAADGTDGAASQPPARDSTASQPEPNPPEAVPEHPILAEWQSKIAGLMALLETAEDIETSGFLTATGNIVVEMAELISEPGVLDKETAWLLPQFLDAVDLLILLELEEGDEPIVEAINLLLQLSRDLTWIASKS